MSHMANNFLRFSYRMAVGGETTWPWGESFLGRNDRIPPEFNTTDGSGYQSQDGRSVGDCLDLISYN